MDEHDKRAREVLADHAGTHGRVPRALVLRVAAALRETAQAAEARGRAAGLAEAAQLCADDARIAWRRGDVPYSDALTDQAARIRDRIRAAPTVEPAQAARDRFTALVEAAGDLPACERCGRVVLAGACCADPVASERDYLHRVVLLARAEPDLPMESVVFQAGQPGREIATAQPSENSLHYRIAEVFGVVDHEECGPRFLIASEDDLVARCKSMADEHWAREGYAIEARDDERARIAARLLARADGEKAEAARLDAVADRYGEAPGTREAAGHAATVHHVVATVLRAEAAALTEGERGRCVDPVQAEERVADAELERRATAGLVLRLRARAAAEQISSDRAAADGKYWRRDRHAGAADALLDEAARMERGE